MRVSLGGSTVKKLVCKWFNLVEQEKFDYLLNEYQRLVADTVLTIDKFQMQSQWEQVKQERERMRLH